MLAIRLNASATACISSTRLACAGLNTLHGTVADVQYMGAHVEYAVDVNGVELTAWSPDEYEKGAAVLVSKASRLKAAWFMRFLGSPRFQCNK